MYCCVYGCNADSSRKRGGSIFYFPDREKSPIRYKNWLTAINRKGFIPRKWSAGVCEKHFKEEDFQETSILKKRLMPTSKTRLLLKKAAIPSLLLNGDGTNHSLPPKQVKSSYFKTHVLNDAITTFDSSDVEQIIIVPEIVTDVENPYIDTSIKCDEELEILQAATESSSFSSDNLQDTTCNERDDKSDTEFKHNRNREIPEYFIVSWQSLQALFKFCNICFSPLERLKKQIFGTVLLVSGSCQNRHKFTWMSGPIERKQQINAVTVITSLAAEKTSDQKEECIDSAIED